MSRNFLRLLCKNVLLASGALAILGLILITPPPSVKVNQNTAFSAEQKPYLWVWYIQE